MIDWLEVLSLVQIQVNSIKEKKLLLKVIQIRYIDLLPLIKKDDSNE